jgi:plastocyanin
MARRGPSHGRLSRLAPAVAVTASLLAPLALVSQAPADETDPSQAAPPTPSAAPAAPGTVNVSRAKASATRTVSIVDFAFDPSALTVKTGDTVTWTNVGTAEEGHDVVGDGLESPTLHSGESYSHTFNTPGTFSYICSIHPDMKGSVEVLERSSGSSKNKSDGGGSGDSGGGSGGGGSTGSSSDTSSGNASGAADSSSDPGGSSGSLPATGEDLLPLAVFGLLFLGAGIALRLAGAGPLRRLG